MEKQKPVVELEIYLIRHGQSLGNAGYGKDNLTLKEQVDPLLTDKGLKQASAAGEHLKDIDFDAVYSSTMLRAIQTATEICRFQPKEKTLRLLPMICEIGVPEGYAEFDKEQVLGINPNAQIAPGVEAGSPMFCCDTHETEDKTHARADKTVAYFRSRHSDGEKIAVISHAAFITNFVFSIMGLSSPMFDLSFDNTGVTRIIFYKHGTYRWGDTVFEYINDTTHLKNT